MLEAKARLDRVLKELPDDAAARKLRAKVLISMERAPEALIDAQRAVDLNPRDGEAYLVLCEAARLSGNRRLSEQALDAAAERVLDDALLHVSLSWNAVELSYLEKAESFARIALALGPSEPAAYLQLARVFVLQGKKEDAASVLARGIRSSVISLSAIRQDSVLAEMLRYPAFNALLQQR